MYLNELVSTYFRPFGGIYRYTFPTSQAEKDEPPAGKKPSSKAATKAPKGPSKKSPKKKNAAKQEKKNKAKNESKAKGSTSYGKAKKTFADKCRGTKVLGMQPNAGWWFEPL